MVPLSPDPKGKIGLKDPIDLIILLLSLIITFFMLRESFEAARRLEENKQPVRAFALEQAWNMLMEAGVIDPQVDSQRPEVLFSTPIRRSLQEQDEVTLGFVVQAWRESLGLSQTEFALRIGRPTTPGYINQLESGKIQQPRPNKLKALASGLGLSLDDLLAHHLPVTDK